jgi:hypothetical protein
MNAPEFPSNDLSIPAEFHACFSGQRAAFLKAPDPSHAERLSDLKALSRLLKTIRRRSSRRSTPTTAAAVNSRPYSGRSSPRWMGFATRKSALRGGCGRAGAASIRSFIPARAIA